MWLYFAKTLYFFKMNKGLNEETSQIKYRNTRTLTHSHTEHLLSQWVTNGNINLTLTSGGSRSLLWFEQAQEPEVTRIGDSFVDDKTETFHLIDCLFSSLFSILFVFSVNLT